jgi:hypothetical protein
MRRVTKRFSTCFAVFSKREIRMKGGIVPLFSTRAAAIGQEECL